MHTQTLILGLLAAAGTTVSALGCYSNGPTFSDMRGGSVDGAISHFCNNFVPRNFGGSQTVSHCYPFPEDNSADQVQMVIKNNQGGSQGISYDECYQSFEIERGACTHGSEQNHGGFWYRIDPNNGKC